MTKGRNKKQCEICLKYFENKSNLNRHKKLHEKKKEFKQKMDNFLEYLNGDRIEKEETNDEKVDYDEFGVNESEDEDSWTQYL